MAGILWILNVGGTQIENSQQLCNCFFFSFMNVNQFFKNLLFAVFPSFSCSKKHEFLRTFIMSFDPFSKDYS